MYVCVFDKDNDCYFRSIVYAVICCLDGIIEYVVFDKKNDRFVLMPRYDGQVHLIETISGSADDLVLYKNALSEYNGLCRRLGTPRKATQDIYAYPDVFENRSFLSEILENGSVPAGKYNIERRCLPDTDVWTYISTQEEADEFMRTVYGLHDARLTKLCYTDCGKTDCVTVIFDDSQWYGVIELCFEGIKKLHLKPGNSTYGFYKNEIYDSTLRVGADGIFWVGKYFDSLDDCDDIMNSYIDALSLKWRKIG